MGFAASKRTEGLIYAKYILDNRPHGKIAILTSAAEDGREYVDGLREGLGEKAATMIVKEAHFDYTNPSTIDAGIEDLKQTGADIFVDMTLGKFATQAIRKTYDIDWHPLQFLPNASLSIAAFIEPAGRESNRRHYQRAFKRMADDGIEASSGSERFPHWLHKYNPEANEPTPTTSFAQLAEALTMSLSARRRLTRVMLKTGKQHGFDRWHVAQWHKNYHHANGLPTDQEFVSGSF